MRTHSPNRNSIISIIVATAVILGYLSSAVAAEKRVTNPPANTPEGVIVASLKLLINGDKQGWIDKYCHVDRCNSATAIKRELRYGLSRAVKNLKRLKDQCLYGGNAIIVTRVNKMQNGAVVVFHKCGDQRMPVPVGIKDGKVYKYSW